MQNGPQRRILLLWNVDCYGHLICAVRMTQINLKCEPVFCAKSKLVLTVAADGQHIYMHAINIRCMVKQFGSLRNCPDIVTATLVEMEPVSMDEVIYVVVGVSQQIGMLGFFHVFSIESCCTECKETLSARSITLTVFYIVVTC
jgi:hypothetical protein